MTRVAVITGANRGLGLECVRVLAGREYRVVLTARSLEKARAAAGALEGDVTPMALDVSSDDSVAAFANALAERFDRVDVLVNNAGVIPDGDEGGALSVPARTLAAAFDTNALGAYRVTQALLPRMNDGGYGRVVMVSSGMGALTDSGPGYPAYRVSKTALNSITRLFHHQAQGNVKVNTVCPGWVRTDMGGPSASRSVEEGASGIVWAATLPNDGPSGGFFRDGEAVEW